MEKLSTSLDMAAILREGQVYLAALEAQGFDLPSLERFNNLPAQLNIKAQSEVLEFAESPSPPIIRKL